MKTVNADSLAKTKRNIEPINIKSGNLLRLASRAKKKRGMGGRIIVTRNVHDVDRGRIFVFNEYFLLCGIPDLMF